MTRSVSAARTDPDDTADVFVRFCRLDDDRDVELQEGWRLLSTDEAARARRFRFDRDRDRFVRGRAFLRRTLGAWTGQPPERLVIATGAHDKPFLADGPQFNLSHSGGIAALALSTRGPVGIDIECDDRKMEIEGVAENCFAGDELDALRSASPHTARRFFFACWTAKEALMKMTGQGMALEPLAIALRLEHGWPRGYLRPAVPRAALRFVETGIADATCCIASLAGVGE